MKLTPTLLATACLAAPLFAQAPAFAQTPAEPAATAQPANQPAAQTDLTALRVLVENGKYADARPLAEAAVKANPNSAEAHDLYARVLANQDKLDDAVKEISQATTLDPKNATLQIHLGDLQLANFHVRFSKWVKDHDKSILGTVNHDVPTAWGAGPTGTFGGIGGGGQTVLETEERINDRSASQMNPKEWESYEKNVKASLAAYNAALALEPNNKLALRGKGIVSVLLGEWKDTIDTFQKAGVPTFDSFLYELGRNMYVGHGKGDEAISMWEMVVKAQPLNAWGYWYLREAYDEYRRGDWHYDYYNGMRMIFSDQIEDASDAHKPSAKDALKELQGVADKHPDFAPVWRGIGIANLKAKDTKAAMAAFQKAATADPTDGYSLLQVGYNQVQSGDATAQKTMMQVVKLRPEDYMAWYALGTAAEKAKDQETAVTAYERSTEIAPRFAEGHFAAAALLLDMRRGAEALPHIEKYLALKPDAKEAKDLRKVADQLKEMLAKQGQ